MPGFTAALALALFLAGDRPFVAVCHAMATLSTSSISPVGGIDGAQSGRLGEMAIALFLLPAVSHRGFSLAAPALLGPRLSDPQIQLMLITVLGVTGVLFLRSFVGAVEIDRQDNLAAALQAIWGSIFTVLSFLTTTGFVSHDWRATQLWSDLPEPGTILLGVAVMGGGIATTAGGIKLLGSTRSTATGCARWTSSCIRASVGRRGQGDALISRGGARIAFIFLMLTLIALALVMLALAATGLGFEHSLDALGGGADHHRPGHRHLRGRARLRRSLRPGAGRLLRRHDRRAPGGAGDHRALQPELLAAVAGRPCRSATVAEILGENPARTGNGPNRRPILSGNNNKGRRVGGLIQLKAEKMAADKQNLQDAFLNNVRKAKVPVTIFLMNGVKLQGVITWFDNFCVLLRRDGQSQLVYKHAISTVMPSQPITLYEAEDH